MPASNEMTTTNSYSHSYEYTIRPAEIHDLPYLPAIERSASSAFLTPCDPALALIADDEPMSAEAHREYMDSWLNHPVVRRVEYGSVVETGTGTGIGTGTWVAVAHQPRSTSDSASGNEAQGEEGVVGFIVTSLLEVCYDKDKEAAKDVDKGQQKTGTGKYFIHIHEVSVHVAHQRKGLAKRLINAVKECAGRIDAARIRSGITGENLVDNDCICGDTAAEVLGLSLTTFCDVAFNAPFYERMDFEVLSVEKIREVIGEDGWVVWEEERERFTAMGDGKLADRRCWMVCRLDR